MEIFTPKNNISDLSVYGSKSVKMVEYIYIYTAKKSRIYCKSSKIVNEVSLMGSLVEKTRSIVHGICHIAINDESRDALREKSCLNNTTEYK